MLYHKPTFNSGKGETAGGPSSSMSKKKSPGVDAYWNNKMFGGPVLNPINYGKKPNNLLSDIIHTKNSPKPSKYLQLFNIKIS